MFIYTYIISSFKPKVNSYLTILFNYFLCIVYLNSFSNSLSITFGICSSICFSISLYISFSRFSLSSKYLYSSCCSFNISINPYCAVISLLNILFSCFSCIFIIISLSRGLCKSYPYLIIIFLLFFSNNGGALKM